MAIVTMNKTQSPEDFSLIQNKRYQSIRVRDNLGKKKYLYED